MKPLHLNLASNPFRDYRPVYAVVVVTSILIAILMLQNIDTYYQYVTETKSTRTKITQLESEAAKEQRVAQSIDERLRSINVASLDKQTRFINSQIAERAFSWSELLDRLERVVPGDVRITSIQPTFQDDGRVHLEIVGEAKTADGLVTTLNHFNSSSQFSSPFPHGETRTTTGTYTFGVAVDYRPTVARVVVSK